MNQTTSRPAFLERLWQNPYLLLILTTMFWGGNITIARGLNQVIPPVTLAFFRWLTALIILLPTTWAHIKRDWPIIKARWFILSVLGFLGITTFNTLLYTAVRTTTAINGSLIQTTMPAMIILITLVLYREKISGRQAIGLVICMSGATFIVLRGQVSNLFSLTFVAGDLLLVLAVFLYALYSVFLRYRPVMHPASFVTSTFAYGELLLLPVFLWELSTGATFPIETRTVLSILYVGIFPSILAYFFWNQGLRLIGANRGGLFINFVPVFASLFAIIFLGERLQFFHIVGMIFIFTGMVLFNTVLQKKL